MAYEHKENKGSIFKNDRKEKDTHPDYTGQINVAGTLYNISGWINESKGGKKILRIICINSKTKR
jgi:hypothetical protein